jgi:membrane dipeptidase
MRNTRIAACALGLAVAAATGLPAGAQDDLQARARALHKQSPLIDGHNDYPWALRERDVGGDFNKADITEPVPSLMTDIPRLRRGGVGAQFWSVYVPAEMQGKDAVRATLEQIDVVHRMTKRWPETFELALTAEAAERAFRSGRIGSMIGMEGGHSIDNSMATLRQMYALGARYMTLTHSQNVPWADSATDQPRHNGLSKFGEAVVREMNRLGMLVDLSHTSPDTMKDVLGIAEAPVIFSHSAARALCNVPRDVPDEVLAMLPKNGGVVMVTFVPGFISQAVADWSITHAAQQQLLRVQFPTSTSDVNAGLERWRAANPEPRATLKQVADHIDHIRKVAGIDHIGLGGDFDGITSVVEGLEDVSKYPDLTAELLGRGYKDDEVKKILGLNVLRAWRGAEQAAARLQKTRGPSTVTIDAVDKP